MKGRTALIAGASGLIGSELMHLLLNSNEYAEVISLVRTPQHIKHPKLKERIIHFDELKTYEDSLTADDVFCCLGTTIKNAKTREAMYKVDVEYPVSLAQLAYNRGAEQFLIVSSMNANPDSFIWYSKIKGELELKIRKVPFHSVSIFRPSLLLGSRKEFRLGERIGTVLYSAVGILFQGPLKKYRAIHAKTVALAMYKSAAAKEAGVTVFSSEEIAAKGR
ncbi:NAD-dependent epimerase/dehydratase family protein [Peribacillus deserti]|uniref:Oxidoreductase n=1 Tax=Peribacillus deserti TaxID=673318 RepID=A0A2N5M802_9BACI|nr:NAD-dependent epimerase/dehydratase family protein [Peribacillus deserti]PLT30462.1 oxidoreductase [Peribacillus deserti]